jgi:anti-sigma regulatory factor (Ser/Thr protein kinase)
VIAAPGDGELEIQVADRGQGFRPRARDTEPSLGLGLPLIAALSDSFEISGGVGQGSRTTIRFGFAPPAYSNNGTPFEPSRSWRWRSRRERWCGRCSRA